MLLEQFNKLSLERRLLLIDVAANSVFKQIVAAELADVTEQLVDESVDGMTPEQLYEIIMPLKNQYNMLKDLQEFLDHIVKELQNKQTTGESHV